MVSRTITACVMLAGLVGCGSGAAYNAKPTEAELKAIDDKMKSDMDAMTKGVPQKLGGANDPMKGMKTGS